MKKIKFYLLLALLSMSTIFYDQVGINKSNPQTTFHVDRQVLFSVDKIKKIFLLKYYSKHCIPLFIVSREYKIRHAIENCIGFRIISIC